jgi:hypothetical protein
MILFCILLLISPLLSHNEKFIDGIACTIVGETGFFPIYYSDAWLANALGVEQTLEEYIVRGLWIIHGKDHGLKITSDGNNNEYAEQYLDMLQEKKNITRDAIKEMCLAAGYTIADIKKELNDQYMMQQAVEMTLAAKGYVSVSSDEVITYYKKNPIKISPLFTIKRGVTSKSVADVSNNRLKEEDIVWDEPYTIEKSALSENFAHIETCNEHDIVYTYFEPKENKTVVFVLLKIIPEKDISLDECYDQIMYTLQSKKYAEGFKEMTLELLNSDLAIFDSPDLKNKCIDYINSKN